MERVCINVYESTADNKKINDITGQRFGFLTATDKYSIKNGKTYWLCKCDCGNTKWIQKGNLMNGQTNSCGKCRLMYEKTHGKTRCCLCGAKIHQYDNFCPKCGYSTKESE